MPPPVAVVEQKVRAAKADFEVLHGIRNWLRALGDVGGEYGESVQRVAFEAYWDWRKEPGVAERVAPLLAGTAHAYGQSVLERGGEPEAALAMLERAWQLRGHRGYRMCEMGLTLAKAYRVSGRFQDAELALDYSQQLLASEETTRWSELGQMMAPIYELNLAIGRAALELELGNPDGMLPHLRRAAGIARKRQPAPKAEWQLPLDQVWSDAIAAMRREKVDFLLGLELFDSAVRTAERAQLELAAEKVGTVRNRQLAGFYLTMARSHVGGLGTRSQDVHRQLERYVAEGSYGQRRVAGLRLVDMMLLDGDLDGAVRILNSIELGDDPNAVTARTDLLMSRGEGEEVAQEELREQRQRQLAAFEVLLRRWQDVPSRDSGVGFLHFLFRRETIGQLVAITLRCDAEADGRPSQRAIADALGHVMRAQVQNGMARRLGAQVPEVASVQQRMAEGHALLVYLPTRSCTHSFVVHADRLVYHRLPGGAVAIRSGIQRFVTGLRTACSEVGRPAAEADRAAQALRTAGVEVTATVLPDLLRAELAKCRHVTVIGSELLHGPISGDVDAGLLNYLPIECLPWDDEQLFGQRFAVDHNVSLPVWWHLAGRVSRFDGSAELSVFGTLRRPGAAAGLPDRLAGGRMSDLRDVFEDVRLELDGDCTMQAVTAEARRIATAGAARRIALFLAHGGYDAKSARGSFLQLVDGRLDCDAAQQLGTADKPFANLVVLAACRAAKAPTRPGDHLANLGGAFLLAGADAVVQARFDLALHSTQALVSEMMSALASGASPAEAMRRARVVAGGRGPLAAFRTGLLQVHGCGQLPRRD